MGTTARKRRVSDREEEDDLKVVPDESGDHHNSDDIDDTADGYYGDENLTSQTKSLSYPKKSSKQLRTKEVDKKGDHSREDVRVVSDLPPESPFRSINKMGRQAEAGVIHRVYVENFMCHRKLTVNLCRNVNFIHGQNGSGKSAILAAIQICLGAGARRTHRARNLKELIRKENADSSGGAKVQVTLLNQGEDAYEHDVYGDYITVERTISLGGGYNGYKLLDEKGKEQSRSKKDLDAMLDQLNIQVENPVAVLDQEEAKKFLMGKAEDKYAFFTKATELERLDRSYAAVQDNLSDLDDTRKRIQDSLIPATENVKKLKAEWEQFQQLEKLEDEMSHWRAQFAWSMYSKCSELVKQDEKMMKEVDATLDKRRSEFEIAQTAMDNDDDGEQEITERLKTLTAEAQSAATSKAELEAELKAALVPLKHCERQLSNLHQEQENSKKRFKSLTKQLQETREEIIRKQGLAQSEEARRNQRLNECEQRLTELKEAKDPYCQEIEIYQKKYEELEPTITDADSDVNRIRRQIAGAEKKLSDLKAGESNSLALFGERCTVMARKVDEYIASRKFNGKVIGPIGKYLKIVEGKDHLASLAEAAIGFGVLDRFIVTNDIDRATFMKLRSDMNCSSRECNVFQMHDGPRYQVKQPPEGVETVSTVLNISDNLVYNCIIDNCNADQLALMMSKQASEAALLVEDRGRCSIRGGNIKQVYFLPNGDKWQVTKGGSLTMTSAHFRLKQSIGVDKTGAIRESGHEIDLLRRELRDNEDKLSRLKQDKNDYMKRWNAVKNKMRSNEVEIKKLESEIDSIKEDAEAAQNYSQDTSELEDEVREAEQAYQDLKGKENDIKRTIDDMRPNIEAIKQRLEEKSARSAKVVADLDAAEKNLEELFRGKNEKARQLEKKREKIRKIEEVRTKQVEVLTKHTEEKDDALSKARIITFRYQKTMAEKKRRAECCDDDEPTLQGETSKAPTKEELESIEPVQTDREPDFYKSKITRLEKDIEKQKERRNLSEKDPEVAYEKYSRAKKDLDAKMMQVEKIDDTIEKLKKDLKSRKKMWKRFRSHICSMTNSSFDDILNKKGSSGDIEFDHENRQLNLVVQKDNRNAMTQTSDVKALSGGERSFTTLSLLLALGECLETPFRVMDEFDVFLDPVSRRIALDTMIAVAKSMEHRQFIFITPQDLSSLATDPKLKIFHMRPPQRSQVVGTASQQTLDFSALDTTTQ